MRLKALNRIQFGAGEWWAIASAVTFAMGNVLTRVVSVEGDPIAGSVIRALPTMLISMAMMIWRHEAIAGLNPKKESFLGWRVMGLLVFSSLVIIPVSVLALYLSFRYGGVLIAVPIFSVNPLWGALMAVPFLGEVFNKRIGGGIIFSVVGMVLLTYGQHTGSPVSTQWVLGVIFAFITALTWALIANFRSYFLSKGLDIFWMIGLNAIGGVLVLAIVLTVTGRLETLAEFSATQIWQLLLSGTLNAVGNFTLTAAFALATIATVSTLKSLDVVLASLVAVLFMGEVLNLPVAAGIIIIVGGVLIVQTGKRQPKAVAA